MSGWGESGDRCWFGFGFEGCGWWWWWWSGIGRGFGEGEVLVRGENGERLERPATYYPFFYNTYFKNAGSRVVDPPYDPYACTF